MASAAPPPSDRTPGSGANWYYLASLLLVLGFISATLPSLSRRAEPWFETGSTFLAQAYHDGWWDNLWKTDGGYLNGLSRVVALLTLKVFGCLKYFPAVAQGLAGLAVAVFASHVNLRCFRGLIPDDRVRFVLGLGLGCGVVVNCGLYPLHNVAYFGVPVLALAAAVDPREMSRRVYVVHLVLVPLLFLSKALMIALLPVYAVRLMAGMWGWSARQVTLYGLGLAAGLGQGYALHRGSEGSTAPPPNGVGYVVQNPAGFATEMLELYANTFPHVLVRQPAPDSQIQMGGLLAAATGCLVAAAVRRRNWSLLCLTAVCVVGSATALALCVMARSPWTPPLGGYQHSMAPSNQLLFVGLVALAAGTLRTPESRLLAALLLTLTAVARRPEPFFDWFQDRNENPSHWKQYWWLIQEDQYAIPCNAGHWMMTRNCRLLNDPKAVSIQGCRADIAVAGPGRTAWSVRAIAWECDPSHRDQPPAALVASDAAGREVGRADRLSRPGQRFQYFLFPGRAASFHGLRFVDAAGKPVPVTAFAVRLYGN